MRFRQSARLAIRSMMGSKVRSFLTMLGIIIGVAAVIILVSLVSGFSKSMTDSFASMGTNLIMVDTQPLGNKIPVDADDMLELVNNNSDLLSAVSPMVNTYTTLKYSSNSIECNINGVSEDYKTIKEYQITAGRFISYMDCQCRNKVCVLSGTTAGELFGATSPVGQTIKIKGDAYTVVGLVKDKESSMEWGTIYTALIPYTTGAYLSGNRSVTSYYFSAKSTDASIDATERIEQYLQKAYGTGEDKYYYYVYNQSDAIEQVKELTNTLTLVLVGIAGISLLVGGIGIMNIMLVSVTERTREIGIRKSLGGRRRDIMRQFIIEAAVTSGLGGIIGIVVGILLSLLVAGLMELPRVVSLNASLIAFTVSVGIGIVFGYMPASKAAKLNPIDALRYD